MNKNVLFSSEIQNVLPTGWTYTDPNHEEFFHFFHSTFINSFHNILLTAPSCLFIMMNEYVISLKVRND